FLLVLILLLMPTLNFLPVWFALSLLRFRLPSRLPMMFILWMVAMMVNSNFFSDKLVLTSVTPASSAPVLQTPKATSSTLYFDSLTVNAGNGGFLHCIQMDTSVNAANQVVSVG